MRLLVETIDSGLRRDRDRRAAACRRDFLANGISVRGLEIERRLDEQINFREGMLRAGQGKHREVLR